MTKPNLENNLIIEELQNERDRQEIEERFPCLKPFKISTNKPGTKVLTAKNKKKTMTLGVAVLQIWFSSNQKNKEAAMSCIYVKKDWRRLGIGTALLKEAENICISKGVNKLAIIYNTENNAVESLIHRSNGWQIKETLTGYLFESKQKVWPIIESLKKATRSRTIGFSIRPLLDCDHDALIQASGADGTPKWAQLDRHQIDRAEQEYSRVIYKGECIIGWVITVAVDQETLDYHILWTTNTHRDSGSKLTAIKALTEIIGAAHFSSEPVDRQKGDDSGSPWKKGFFISRTDNAMINNFARKRLTGSASQQNRLNLGEKRFNKT